MNIHIFREFDGQFFYYIESMVNKLQTYKRIIKMDPQLIKKQQPPTALTFDLFYQHLIDTPLTKDTSFSIQRSPGDTSPKLIKKVTTYLTGLCKTHQFIKNQQKQPLNSQCKNVMTDRVYICYDCKNNAETFLCKDCFYQAEHHLHCRHEIKQINPSEEGPFSCQCGNYTNLKYRGTCSKHRTIQFISTLTPAQQLVFTTRVTQFFKLLIVFRVNLKVCLKTYKFDKDNVIDQLLPPVSGNQGITSFIFEKLWNTNLKNYDYIKTIQQILLTKICLKDSFTAQQINWLLQQKNLPECPTLLSIFFTITPDSKQLLNLIQSLLVVENTQFIENIFQNLHYNKDQRQIRELVLIRRIRFTNKISPKLICRCLEQATIKHKILTSQQHLGQVLQLLTQISYSDSFLSKQQKIEHSLISCWQFLLYRGYLKIDNIIKNHNISISSVLNCLIYIPKLFYSLLTDFIQFIYCKVSAKYILKTEQPTSRKINLAEMVNLLGKVLTTYSQGNLVQGANFLRSLDIDDKIVTIFYYYAWESLNFVNNLSQLSLFVFGVYLDSLRQSGHKAYQQYRALWSKQKIKSERFLDFVAKFLNIALGQQLKWLSKMSTNSSITPEQRQKIQKIQQQKFKQLLFMRKVYPIKQMHQLQKQNILNFKQAPSILKKYTKFDYQNNCFKYRTHYNKSDSMVQQDYFSYDGLLNNIFILESAEKLQFNDNIEDDTSFDAHARRQIIQGILTPLMESICFQEQNNVLQINPKQCKLVTKNHRYAMSTCLIIIDKIVKGNIKQLRHFLKTQKQSVTNNKDDQISQQMRQKLMKLFKVNNDGKKKGEIANQIKMVNTQLNNSNFDQPNKNKQIQGTTEINVDVASHDKISVQISSKQSIGSPNSKPSPVKKAGDSKRKKIAEKYLKKRQTFFQSLPQHLQPSEVDHHDICMICKEQSHQNNSLFYLGVIKKQTQDYQIFDNGYQTGYTITTCMHMLHQKCFTAACKPNSSNHYSCPLCKISANIVLPLESTAMSSHTQQFLQSRFNYAFVALFNEYHHDRCFILLLRSLISELIFHTILRVILPRDNDKIKDKQGSILNNKKVRYYMELLSRWWDGLLVCQKEYYYQKIDDLLQQSKTSQNQKNKMVNISQKSPKLIIDQIVTELTLSKLMQRDSKLTLDRLFTKLQSILTMASFKSTLSTLHAIFDYPIEYKYMTMDQQQQGGIDEKEKVALMSYYFRVPHSVSHLRKVTQTCQYCHRSKSQTPHIISVNYCIICSKAYCNKCDHEKLHGKNKAYVDSNNANLLFVDKAGKQHERKIYYSSYMQAWKIGTCEWDSMLDYGVDYQYFSKTVAQWLTILRQ